MYQVIVVVNPRTENEEWRHEGFYSDYQQAEGVQYDLANRMYCGDVDGYVQVNEIKE